MADALKDVQRRFDKLVRDIISRINRIINKLKKDKERIIQIYKDEVKGYYLSRREVVNSRGAQFDTLAKEKEAQIPDDKRGEFDALVDQIQKLRDKLEKLMQREMQIGVGVALKIKDEPARIEKEIRLMNILLNYIKDHVKVGRLFSRGKLISRLNTDAIYQRIIDVYKEVKSRETENKVVKYYLEMRKEIEQQSGEILSGIDKLMEILGAEEKAVSPEALKKKEKAVEKAEKVLKREENYFMLFSDVLKQLRAVAASNIRPERKLNQARSLLKRLERYERNEQWRASVSKLKGKIKNLEKIRITIRERQDTKTIEAAINALTIFEGDLLIKTVKGLGEKIKSGVQAEQVNWQEIIAIIDQIQKDIQAAIAVDERLDNLLENERRGIRGRVGAGLGAVGRGPQVDNTVVAAELRRRLGHTLPGAPAGGPPLPGAPAGARGRGIGRVGSGIKEAGLRAVMAKENIGRGIGGAAKAAGDKIVEAVKAAYSGVAGAAGNVWGALGNWWSGLSGAAGNLADAAKSKADLSGSVNAVKAFGGNGLKAANTGVGFLIGNAQKVLKMPIDIKAKERISALAGELSKLQSAIGNAIGRLRPGLPREKIKAIADFTVANSKRAAEVAKTLGGELGKVAGVAPWAKAAGDKIVEAVKAAYSGVAGAAGNVWGTLGNWWSGLSGAAGNLADAAKSRTGDLSGSVNAVKVFGGKSLGAANTGVGFLIGNAQKVLKMPHVDIKAKERISALASELGKLQSATGNAIGRLRPGLPREQIKGIADFIVANSKRAAELAKALGGELGKVAGAGKVIGSAGGAVAGAAKAAGDKIVEAVKAAYSGVAGAAGNVWGALGNWWSGLSGAAGNLADAAKSKADLSGLIDAVKAFGGNSLKAANTGVGFLIGNAQKVLKMPHVDIKAKERISALAGKLSELQTTIGDAIGRLKPDLPREQIKGIADFIVANSKRAAELAKALGGELGKVTAVGGVAKAAGGAIAGMGRRAKETEEEKRQRSIDKMTLNQMLSKPSGWKRGALGYLRRRRGR